MRADAVVVFGREPRGFAVHARERARIVGAHEVVDAEARGGVAAARDEGGRWGSAPGGCYFLGRAEEGSLPVVGGVDGEDDATTRAAARGHRARARRDRERVESRA